MTTTEKIEALEQEARELAARQIVVATNSGTFSAVEARRKIGTGDPAYAERRVYVVVGTGERIATGPSEDDAPGFMRQINRHELRAAQARLAELRHQIAAIGDLA